MGSRGIHRTGKTVISIKLIGIAYYLASATPGESRTVAQALPAT